MQNGNAKSRQEANRQRSLNEARKLGQAPAELDAISGKEINPHIPQFISQAPWYLKADYPTLSHQRVGNHKQKDSAAQDDQWYKRGEKLGPASTKFRKGACENCGAMSHKTRECVERPRAKKARWTGKDLQADEAVSEIQKTWDGKRDRWAGYDGDHFDTLVEAYQSVENERKKTKVDEIQSEHSSEDEKFAEDLDMPGQKVDKKSRVTQRNLRIREDTAKYLRNLDPESAYYDPKSRSLREMPNPEQTNPDAVSSS